LYLNTVQIFNFQGHTFVFLPDYYFHRRSLRCLFAGVLIFKNFLAQTNQPWWQHVVRYGSAAANSLGLRVRIPPGSWISCHCCLLPGRGLCIGLITRPEDSYQLLRVSLGVTAEPGY